VPTPRIVLFYAFAPVADPVAVRLWQQALAERWGLRGRVVVAPHGINATLGGDVADLKQYLKTTRRYPGFERLDVKWSDGTGEDFPRLSVKARPELVAFGVPDEIVVGPDGVQGGGARLTPDELDALVAERGDDVVLFDGRNAFEARTGRFAGAVVPDVATTHDFVPQLDAGRYDHLKGKAVVTYCTGGVRCEILSAVMRSRGFGEVYQLDGGIVRYGEARGSGGLWQGSLYVFDGRGAVRFDEGCRSLGECERCGRRTDRFRNCADAACTTLRLGCEGCVPGAAFDDRCPACEALRPAGFRERSPEPAGLAG